MSCLCVCVYVSVCVCVCDLEFYLFLEESLLLFHLLLVLAVYLPAKIGGIWLVNDYILQKKLLWQQRRDKLKGHYVFFGSL